MTVIITDNFRWTFICLRQATCIPAMVSLNESVLPCLCVFWCQWGLEGSLISLEISAHAVSEACMSAQTAARTLCVSSSDSDSFSHRSKSDCVYVMRTEILANVYISPLWIKLAGWGRQKKVIVIDSSHGVEHTHNGRKKETGSWAKGAAVRCEAWQYPWWDAICECVYSYWPVLIMTKRANSHLSFCLAECVSTVGVAPPAAGGSSVEWLAMARHWALGPGCVSSVCFI